MSVTKQQSKQFAGMVMATVFWDSNGVVCAYLEKRQEHDFGENTSITRNNALLLLNKLMDNFQAQCLQLTKKDPVFESHTAIKNTAKF